MPYPESVLADTVAIGLCVGRPAADALTHKASVEVNNQRKPGYKNLACGNQQTRLIGGTVASFSLKSAVLLLSV